MKIFPNFWRKEVQQTRRENPKSAADWLQGETLRGLVATEFWLGEELVNAYCIVFVKTGKGICRLSWNDDPEWWELEPTEEFPVPEQVPYDPALGDEHFRYPVIDLAARYDLLGQQIRSFKVTEDPNNTADLAILELASGTALQWSYRFKTEQSVLEVLSADAQRPL